MRPVLYHHRNPCYNALVHPELETVVQELARLGLHGREWEKPATGAMYPGGGIFYSPRLFDIYSNQETKLILTAGPALDSAPTTAKALLPYLPMMAAFAKRLPTDATFHLASVGDDLKPERLCWRINDMMLYLELDTLNIKLEGFDGPNRYLDYTFPMERLDEALGLPYGHGTAAVWDGQVREWMAGFRLQELGLRASWDNREIPPRQSLTIYGEGEMLTTYFVRMGPRFMHQSQKGETKIGARPTKFLGDIMSLGLMKWVAWNDKNPRELDSFPTHASLLPLPGSVSENPRVPDMGSDLDLV